MTTDEEFNTIQEVFNYYIEKALEEVKKYEIEKHFQTLKVELKVDELRPQKKKLKI